MRCRSLPAPGRGAALPRGGRWRGGAARLGVSVTKCLLHCLDAGRGPWLVRRLRAVGILADTATTAGAVLMALLLLVGCSGIGPGTVTRDRFDSTAAVAESWKSQMLLNLMKIRYGDTPVFLDVGQIVTGYTRNSAMR
jgi:hypothetical protein